MLRTTFCWDCGWFDFFWSDDGWSWTGGSTDGWGGADTGVGAGVGSTLVGINGAGRLGGGGGVKAFFK